jgi:acetyltransferase
VLDARVVLHDPSEDEAALPRPAIRPYPSQYVKPFRLSDGTDVGIRPIRPEDEPAIVEFHRELSERSVRLRYFQPLQLGQRTAHERLIRVCFGDYDRELALIVERKRPTGGGEIVAVGRLSKIPGQTGSEFAILISDAWQHRGLGTELLSRLIQIGKDEKVSSIAADILPDNVGMRRVCEKVGFKLKYQPGDGVVRAVLLLDETRA